MRRKLKRRDLLMKPLRKLVSRKRQDLLKKLVLLKRNAKQRRKLRKPDWNKKPLRLNVFAKKKKLQLLLRPKQRLRDLKRKSLPPPKLHASRRSKKLLT